MSTFQILVQSIPLCNQLLISLSLYEGYRSAHVLLPLPEPAFLQFDLFGKPLPEHLLFLLELWIVDLLDFWFSEFTGFHLSKSVRLVVRLFSRGDQVKHVGSDKEGSKFLEITMVFVLDCLSAG